MNEGVKVAYSLGENSSTMKFDDDWQFAKYGYRYEHRLRFSYDYKMLENILVSVNS